MDEIRKWLTENRKYFLEENNCSPQDIVACTNYKLTWECGHKFEAIPRNVIYDNEIHCPICAGKQVLVGYNDIATTAP